MKIIIVLFSVILIVRGQQESIIRARCAALQTTADTFIRNSFNCRGYHVCRNRDYIGSALCGEGLYFDGDQRCEFSQNVECAVCSNPPLAGAEQVKVPGACNKYGLCINEEIFVQTCASGLIWGTNGCVDPGNPPPNPPPGTPTPLLPCAACPNFYNTPAFVLVPDIWECNQFIRCFAIPTNPPGPPVASTREQCPNGVFDSTTSSCSTAPGATCGSVNKKNLIVLNNLYSKF